MRRPFVSSVASRRTLETKLGVRMDTFMADALAEKLDDIERIDRLTSIAESRRQERLHHSGPLRREIHLESLRMRRLS